LHLRLRLRLALNLRLRLRLPLELWLRLALRLPLELRLRLALILRLRLGLPLDLWLRLRTVGLGGSLMLTHGIHGGRTLARLLRGSGTFAILRGGTCTFTSLGSRSSRSFAVFGSGGSGGSLPVGFRRGVVSSSRSRTLVRLRFGCFLVRLLISCGLSGWIVRTFGAWPPLGRRLAIGTLWRKTTSSSAAFRIRAGSGGAIRAVLPSGAFFARAIDVSPLTFNTGNRNSGGLCVGAFSSAVFAGSPINCSAGSRRWRLHSRGPAMSFFSRAIVIRSLRRNTRL
jgi:hypothetical protein